jgi:hypothetical protein
LDDNIRPIFEIMKKCLILGVVSLLSILNYAQTSQNALDFDGSNDYVQTTFGGVAGTANRTFEAWVYITSAPSGNSCILDYGANAVGSRNTFFVNTNRAIGYISGGTNANITSSTNAVPLNTWTHVAFVLDNGTGYLYVNGQQKGTGNLSTVNTGTGGTNLRIGERVPGGSIPFDGIIDEVRIWNVAKSATQLTALKDEELCSSQTGLVAYYRCNEGTANGSNTSITTLQDNSNSSNNGTLTNFGLSGSSSNWVNGAPLTAAPNTDTTLNIESCGSYFTPGGQFVNTSRTVTETISNSVGCDSLITLNITIKQTSFSRDTIVACDSFRTPTGILYTSSRIYNETYTNTVGCDSVVQRLLLINYTQRDTQNITSCGSYQLPSGLTITASGTYSDSLSSSASCDSFVTYNINITQPSSSVLADTTCGTYISPRGNIYTESGTYRDTLINHLGCDSVVIQNIIVNHPSDTLLQKVGCDSLVSESGQNTWFLSGGYSEMFSNQQQCDSTVRYDVSINFSSPGVFFSDTIVCGESYISPLGQSIGSTQIITETTQNRFGCDSSYQISVKFHSVEAPSILVQEKDTLIASNAYGTQYQWYNCDNFTNLSNAQTSKISWKDHSTTLNFGVAVANSRDNCVDSLCIKPDMTNSISKTPVNHIIIYPNPNNGIFTISNASSIRSIEIFNTYGALIEKLEKTNHGKIDMSHLPKGNYFIKIETRSNQVQHSKISFSL